jgi:Inner membrane component of T3SS, cytoplasmic domain
VPARGVPQDVGEPVCRVELAAPSALGESSKESTRALAGAILSGVLAPPPTGPRVIVLEGPSAGRSFALTGVQVVGRGRGTDICVADSLVSRRHLVLELHDGVVTALDLGSKNGFTVNGHRPGEASVTLQSGDALALGRTILVYQGGAEVAPVRELAAPAPSPEPAKENAPTPRGAVPRWAWGAAVPLALLLAAALLAQAAGW